MPDYISFDIDTSSLSSQGKYETSLIIEILTDPIITKRVPVIVVAGNREDTASLTLVNPYQGQIFVKGDQVTIELAQNINPPGWKRIEYYLQHF